MSHLLDIALDYIDDLESAAVDLRAEVARRQANEAALSKRLAELEDALAAEKEARLDEVVVLNELLEDARNALDADPPQVWG